MAQGMVNAVLDTLRTRSWKVEGKDLTGQQVVSFYHALGESDPNACLRAVGDVSRSGRRFDRAVQILKRAGLIVHYGGKWRHVRTD